MTSITLADLQASVQDKVAFSRLADYLTICQAFLSYLQAARPTRIVSPTHQHYIFYQYDAQSGYSITRPLNTRLFIEAGQEFVQAFERCLAFLGDLRRYERAAAESPGGRAYVESGELNKVVYTIQQSIGCVGDSFENANQSRKRIGQLFEVLITLLIQEVGVVCEPRTVKIPIPDNPGYAMSYQLDLVFSRKKAILASETEYIHSSEIVGSVKTTSKDRLDKIFLDKYLLARLLGRQIPVVAIFLHDVQRANVPPNLRTGQGKSLFGINSTFKTNHFLGYTLALNSLDGVYYVDPRPEMLVHERLREQIRDFQQFLVMDLWKLSS